MIGFLGKLFGTDVALKEGAKIASKATGGIISGLDAAFYTKEENVRDIKEVLFKLQDQYTPRSISRRLIALIFTSVYCLFALVTLAFACYGKMLVVGSIIKVAGAYSLSTIMITIVIFYFGYYGVQSIMGKNKKKK